MIVSLVLVSQIHCITCRVRRFGAEISNLADEVVAEVSDCIPVPMFTHSRNTFLMFTYL